MHKLILIRHGQSTANIDEEFYNLPDSCVALTMEGIKQSVKCAETLKAHHGLGMWNLGFSTFASKHARAQQTARVVLDCIGLRHVHPHITPALNERDERHEDHAHANLRIKHWWDKHDHLLYSGNVMIFCHAYVLQSFIHILTDEEPLRHIPNATPFIFDHDEKGYTRIY